MFPLSIEARLIAWAVAAAAALGALAWFVAHERAIGQQSLALAVAQRHDADVAAAREREAQINASQQEANHEADRFHLAAALDARDAADADRRLQQRFAAINARCMPGDPATAAASAPASQSDPSADAFRMVVEAARRLAADADAEREAGELAERDYDALTVGR